MKKILIVLTFLTIFFPLNLGASNISAKLNGPKEITIGEQLIITYTLNISDISASEANERGILMINYDIDYDKSLLSLRNVQTNNYDTIHASMNDETEITSIPKTMNCIEQSAYCGSGSYTATITFDILAKESKTTGIKITDPIVAILDVNDIANDVLNGLTMEEIIEKALKESPNNFETLVLTIKKPMEKDTRSSNTFLSSIEIQNYDINFDKTISSYNLEVGKNVKKIVVNATPEDSKALVRIKGAEDLAANENKVTIEITAENGTKASYIINITHKSAEDEILPAKTEKTSEEKIMSDKKILKILIITAGVIILIVILFIIRGVIKRKQIAKMFEDDND